MSSYKWDFDMNVKRVDNLMKLYKSSSHSKTRASVEDSDLLRAAVVFLHSAFENYYREVIIDKLPACAKEQFPKMSLGNNENVRADKFFIADLLEYKGKFVDDVIVDAIKEHLAHTSFNDFDDVQSWATRISISLEPFKTNTWNIINLNDMIHRRHKIVHEADKSANYGDGTGYHRATSISQGKVHLWVDTVKSLVNLIEGQINLTSAPLHIFFWGVMIVPERKGHYTMELWQIILAGLGALIALRLAYRAISKLLYNRSEQRRVMNRIYELREQGYSNENFYIDTSYGIPVVRLYED